MVYDYPPVTEAISQGDIFSYLPLGYVQLDQISDIKEDGTEDFESGLEKIQKNEQVYTKILMEPAIGIVATQDCDSIKNEFISFFKIEPFKTIAPNIPFGKSKEKREKYFRYVLDGYIADGYSWLYLPLDSNMGFQENMAINFDVIFQIERKSLEAKMNLRKGRLSSEKLDHYRHTISNYFTRYAYEKMSVLTPDEEAEYKALG